MTLYIFNPEHDYALAHNDEHFMALQSAVQFANDCAPFLRYVADDEEQSLFLPYSAPLPDLSGFHPAHVVPWGWDKLVTHQLRNAGLSDEHLPTPEQLDNIRTLAHRKTSITAMDFLRAHCTDVEIPRSAQLLTEIEQVEQFIKDNRDAIFKSPYSGNGRGNLYAHGVFSPTLERQCRGVLRRQGSILAEPLYNIVQDFAMEFECRDNNVRFAGYSLFETKYYGYAGNRLCSDKEIEDTLSQWIAASTLSKIKDALIQFIQENIEPNYRGFLGVDMFVYQDSEKFKLNPMVEINLRMTMGMAAHTLYERYMHPQSTGSMRIEFRPDGLGEHVQSLPEMQYRDGKWFDGGLCLTPVTDKTQYAVIVTATPDKGAPC